MADFPGAAWFEDLKEKVNRVEGFQQAARWFQGKVGWKVDDVTYLLSIADGRVQSVQIDPEGADFTMSGDLAAWRELMDIGTINRLFRLNRITIEGDKVTAFRFWKILWFLTETARGQ